MLAALWSWAWGQIWPNLVADAVTVVVGYLWKIRPHLKRQAAHREHVAAQLASLHEKVDADG